MHTDNTDNVKNLAVGKLERDVRQNINSEVMKLVDCVFAKFFIICRGAHLFFNDPKKLLTEKGIWFNAFERRGYKTMHDIRFALIKLDEHQYPSPPQIGEFLKWNEPPADDMGLLTADQAFNRSAEHIRDGKLQDLSDDQNMLIERTVKYSDRYFLRNNPESKTRPVFNRNYEIALKQFRNGECTDIPKAITDDRSGTLEFKKQQNFVLDEFKHLDSYEKAMPAIKRMLGMKIA